jgi:hypothetical protein
LLQIRVLGKQAVYTLEQHGITTISIDARSHTLVANTNPTVGPVQGAGDGGELAAGVDVLEHGLLQPREVAVALLEH